MRVPSLVGVVYLVIGFVVAARYDYFEDLDRVRRILSAVLAVLLWPLVLLGVDFQLR
jgi:hypothetical protein